MQNPGQNPGAPMPGPGMFPPPPAGGMFPPPPMYPMMPPPGYGPPPPPRRSGAGKAVAIVLLLLLLGVSVLVNLLVVGAAAVSGGGGGMFQETITAGDPDQTIAVVPLVGLIDKNMSRQFDAFLKRAEQDADVKAVIVEIDTPGGTVTGSDEIYARLLRFKRDKRVPVVVSMGSLATSGGYYAACGADYIFAQDTSLTGNIGVLLPSYNFSKLMEKHGVEERTIVNKGSPFKNAGSDYSPELPEHRAHLQEIADKSYERFKGIVQQARASRFQQAGVTVEQVADGRAFLGPDAKANGLIDQVGYLHDVIAYVSSTHGLSKPNVVRYANPPPSLFDLMRQPSPYGIGQSSGAGHGDGAVTVNGVNVNVNVGTKLLDELSSPRLMYLYRGD
jgi:protease-4